MINWLQYNGTQRLIHQFLVGWDLEENHCIGSIIVFLCLAPLQVNLAKKSGFEGVHLRATDEVWIKAGASLVRYGVVRRWQQHCLCWFGSLYSYCQIPRAVNPEVLNLSQVST